MNKSQIQLIRIQEVFVKENASDNNEDSSCSYEEESDEENQNEQTV